MIKNINDHKARMKERLLQEVDDYFANLETDTTEEGFDINTLEQRMLENHRRVKQALNESNSELASNIEVTTLKKTAQNVASH